MISRGFTTAGLILILGAACSEKNRYPDYGLRSFEIRMKKEHVGQMLGGAMQHVKVPGRVVFDGDSHAVQVSAAGASTIDFAKKSLNLIFNEDRVYDGSTDHRLSTTIEDASMLRTLLALEIFEAAGIPSSRVEPAFVYLNERVMGLYMRLEKVDEEFFDRRGIAWDQLIEAQDKADFGPDFEGRLRQSMKVEAGHENLEIMLGLTRTLRAESDSEFESEVFRFLDRDQVVRYMAAGALTNHWDGFNRNLYYYRGPDGKFRLAPWDFDFAWRNDKNSSTEPWMINRLFTRIGRLPAVRAEIDARIASLLAGAASPATLSTRIDFWKNRIADAYAADPILGHGGKSLEVESQNLRQEIDDWLAKF